MHRLVSTAGVLGFIQLAQLARTTASGLAAGHRDGLALDDLAALLDEAAAQLRECLRHEGHVRKADRATPRSAVPRRRAVTS
jgi:hypothetical protein